jgi:hypothetical protein
MSYGAISPKIFGAGLPDGIGIFKPKIPIWVNYEGPYIQWKMLAVWSILLQFSVFCRIFNIKFMVIWYKFFPFWYVVPRKIWQP